MITEVVPGEVMGQLEDSQPEQRPVLLTTSTDISLEGVTERQWLVVTNCQLSIVREGGAGPLLTLPLEKVGGFRTSAGVGSGVLQARVDGVWCDILRYSNTLDDRFHKVATKLEHLRTDGVLEMLPEEEVDPRCCRDCGLRLPAVGETCPRCLPRGAILNRVWELIRPQRRGAILLCLLTFVGVAAELVPPKLQQYLVDNVLGETHTGGEVPHFLHALLLVVLALAGSRVVLAVVAAIKGQLATRIGAALTSDLRARLVKHLQELAVSYYDRHQVGSLMSRVAYDTEVLHGLVHQITGGFLLQILQLIGVGAMLVILNPKLALFTLIPVPLVIGSTWFFWQRIYPRYYRYWDSASKQVAALSSMLAGIRVVKGFAQEVREFDRFRESSEYLRSTRLWVEESSTKYSAWMQIVFSLGGLIVWYVGGRDVIGQSMTLGSLIAFLAYLAMFYAPLATLSNFTTWLTSFLTGAKRVLELLDTPVTVREPADPVEPGPAHGHIVFEDVRFGYDRHQPVLKGVSFEARPGEMIGIVGRSGSGKTTLVNLLGRFYDVDDGRVLVDGIDTRRYRSADLRRRIGIVFQETYLFRGTIWENLSYGMPDATIEQTLVAAKAAGAHDFIVRSALGYETPLGERGAGLSGGERQRLSLARALLYDPPILVLDEATSNVDTEAERSIQEALSRLTAGRTTIAIAHRLSTLRNADRILVFDRGRLAEEGRHEELLEQDGIYARLVRIQTQLSRDSNVDQLVEQTSDNGSASHSAQTKTNGTRTHLRREDGVKRSSNGHTKTKPDSAQPLAGNGEREIPAPHEIEWLDPHSTQIRRGELGMLELELPGRKLSGVFVICTFPATTPEKYLSLRTWDDDGDQHEVGMIRDLSEWPASPKELVRSAIRRRYLLRNILEIESLELEHGYLWFRVRTDRGPSSFSMRWSQSQAIDFGPRGKMIHDVEDNRYVVSDVAALSPRDQELFRRYVYW